MASSRYASFDTRSSSTTSDPSPPPSDRKKPSKHTITNSAGSRGRSIPPAAAAALDSSSRALTRTRSDASGAKNAHNFGTMVKKFMEKRSNLKPGKADRTTLVIPADAIAADLKKVTAAGTNGGSKLSMLHRKLFQKGGSADREASAGKALIEVKANTRTLAMVLRSERELLSQNKEYEAEISELRLLLEEKNREVEKLKHLSIKQREEIKALKDAVLFPEVMNSQLQELLERRGSELKQEMHIIPDLQEQISSLTGQIKCLKEDLAEVKADKYTTMTRFDGHVNSPKTPIFDHEAANSLEHSYGDSITYGYGSPDDMFLKDLNPCLTPPCFSKSKSKEFNGILAYDSPNKGASFQGNTSSSPDMSFFSHAGVMSMSSEHCERPSLGSITARKIYRSDESKWSAGKATY